MKLMKFKRICIHKKINFKWCGNVWIAGPSHNNFILVQFKAKNLTELAEKICQ